MKVEEHEVCGLRDHAAHEHAKDLQDVAESLGDDPLFEIANHSLEHKAFRPCYTLPVLRNEEKAAAVSESEQVIKQITGKRPYYFRFPGGSIECARYRRGDRAAHSRAQVSGATSSSRSASS